MNFYISLFLVLSVLSLSGILNPDSAEAIELQCPQSSGNYTYINGSAHHQVYPIDDDQISLLYCEYQAPPESELESIGDIYALYNFTGQLTPERIGDDGCGGYFGSQFYYMYVSSTTRYASVAFSSVGLIEAASELMTQIEVKNIGPSCPEQVPESTEDPEDDMQEPTLEITNQAIEKKPIEEIKEKIEEYEEDFEKEIEEKTVVKLEDHEIVTGKNILPDWIKKNAKWWSTNQITDEDFVLGIEFMIKNGFIKIPLIETAVHTSGEIPQWVKNNAGWWSEDLISEPEYVNGLQYLISNGIISVV